MNFTDSITIYKHYTETVQGVTTDKWDRTVISGVQASQSVRTELDSKGIEITTVELKVTVPYRGKQHSFRANGLDIVVLGKCTKEITANYTIRNLQSDYTAGTIEEVKDNTNRDMLKHWRLKSTWVSN